MSKQCSLVLIIGCCVLHSAPADTIQLKEKATIVGKILSEKREQVAVDIGYTVLVVPRNQILKISRTDAPEQTAQPAVATKAADKSQPLPLKPGLYSAPIKPGTIRNVRD